MVLQELARPALSSQLQNAWTDPMGEYPLVDNTTHQSWKGIGKLTLEPIQEKYMTLFLKQKLKTLSSFSMKSTKSNQDKELVFKTLWCKS